MGSWRAAKAGLPFRFRAAVLKKCGEWAWHTQLLGMRCWQNAVPCWLCNGMMHMRCCSLAASWRQHRCNHRASMASVMRGEQFLSRVMSIPGFAVEYVVPGWMHTVCLGVLQYLCGNVKSQLLYTVHGTWKNSTQACSILLNLLAMVAKGLGLECTPCSS